MEPTTLKLLVFVGIIAGSFGLGWLIARMLRLRNEGFKIGVVIFTFGFGMSPFINAAVVEGRPWYDAVKFGIDLAGGTNLVYQLAQEPSDPAMMDRMVGAIRRRIDPAGTQELAIRQVGKDRIELIIPRATAEDIDKIKRQMTTVGKLEFHILANNRDHADIIRRAQGVPRDLRDSSGRLIAGWRPVAPRTLMENGRPVLKDGKPVKVPSNEFREGEEIAVRQIPGAEPGYREVLVIFDRNPDRWVTGRYLQRAAPTTDEAGRPAVSFVFNARGANLFSQLTGSNLPLRDGFHRRLAILLDDEVYSAPNINSTIGGNGIIQGSFTMAEVNELVNVLNAGALEVPLKESPISEFSISPTLGIDVQRKGITSIVIAAVSVFVFMAAYYLIAGLIADFCLLLNLVLLVGIMALIDATFTLPGLAGVVLTLGMAVDANVLIYERIREELHRGASLRMAIQNGFARAFSSIFDSNITTLLTAVILYIIGTDQVRGFAVTLFIGIALSMYTALFVNRLILEILERKRWIKTLKMLSFIGETHFDFVKPLKLCATFSIAITVIGLGAFFARGDQNYDIDFTGGTMITMEFVEPQSPDVVQETLAKAFDSDISLERLTEEGQTGEKGRLFRVRTTEQDQGKVQATINDAFPDLLKRVTMSYGEIAAIEPPAAEANAEQPAPEATATQGHQVQLTFSSPIAPATASSYLMQAIATVKNDAGDPKYGSAELTQSLFTLSGPEGVKVEEGAVEKYETMVLKTDKALAEEDLKAALAAMQTTMANTPLFEEVNSFEAVVASEAKAAAVLAILASLVMIVAYVWFRFQNAHFGFAAVVALAHDVLTTLGLISIASLISDTPIGSMLLLSDFKINLTMIAAFLTIVGYSLNDTIVIFDRLREIRGKNPSITRDMLNLAVNQTLSRTLLTAGTSFIVVFILYVMGGEGIHGFAFAMCLGVIIGTYSTIFVASPLVLYLMNRSQSATKKPAPALATTKS